MMRGSSCSARCKAWLNTQYHSSTGDWVGVSGKVTEHREKVLTQRRRGQPSCGAVTAQSFQLPFGTSWWLETLTKPEDRRGSLGTRGQQGSYESLGRRPSGQNRVCFSNAAVGWGPGKGDGSPAGESSLRACYYTIFMGNTAYRTQSYATVWQRCLPVYHLFLMDYYSEKPAQIIVQMPICSHAFQTLKQLQLKKPKFKKSFNNLTWNNHHRSKLFSICSAHLHLISSWLGGDNITGLTYYLFRAWYLVWI